MRAAISARQLSALGFTILGFASVVCGNAACGPGAASGPGNVPTTGRGAPVTPPTFFRSFDARPAVGTLARNGDPAPAACVAMRTAPLSDDTASSLGAWLVERLRTKGIDASASAPRGGVIVCSDRDSDTSMTSFVAGVTSALGERVTDDDVAKVRAARARVSQSTLELGIAECLGTPTSAPFTLTSVSLDEARTRVRARSRVAFGVVGTAGATQALLGAVERGPAWPDPPIAPGPQTTVQGAAQPSVVVAQAREVPHGRIWMTVTQDTRQPLAALGAATRAGREGLRRARAQDPRVTLESVGGVSRGEGGCAHVTLSIATGEGDVAQSLANTAAILEAELGQGATANAPPTPPAPVGSSKDAARHLAWWALSRDDGLGQSAPRATILVAPSKATPPVEAEPFGAAWRKARAALDKPRIELRSKIEAGQSEVFAVLGSPCGTGPEALADAGSGALVVSTVSAEEDSDIEIRAIVDSEGLGLVAHGQPRPGEAPLPHAERIGEALGRAFASMAESPQAADRSISARLAAAGADDELLAFARLASAVAPAHPSWLLPFGTPDANARMTARALGARAVGLRQGPIRLAVLATDSEAQAQGVARAAERWLFPREASGSCGTPQAMAPTPGTYALQRRSAGPSVVYLAAPLPELDDGTDAAARVLLRYLDADDGSLRGALKGSARELGVRLVGRRERAALVVRVVTAPDGVDAAVERLRNAVLQLGSSGLDAPRLDAATQRALREQTQRHGASEQRVTDLFLGRSLRAPNAEAVRTLATQALQGERLIVTVLRPQASK